MNNLILILLIQVGLLLLTSFLGFLFTLARSKNVKRVMIFSIITSLIILGFAITVLSIFLVNFFNVPLIQIKESVPIIIFASYSFEIGFQITLAQCIIYFTAMFILALSNVFLTWKKAYWKESYTGRISLYSLPLVLMILSTNFFQILLFMIIADLILIDLIINLTLVSKEKITVTQKSMIASFIIGNVFFIVSSVLLAYKTKSLDFNIITNEILTNPAEFETILQLLISLLLLGIITKNALFPFHTWFKNVCSSNGDSIFLFLSTHFTIALAFIFITPFAQLISLQGSAFFIWYGLLLALISVIFSLFLKNELETVTLIFTLLSGLLLFILGLGNLSIAFQLLIVMPIICMGLVPFLFVSEISKDEEKSRKQGIEIALSTARFLGFLVIIQTILGVEPLNSSFLILLQTLAIDPPIFNIGFFVLALLVFLGIFYLFVLIFSKQLSSVKYLRFTKIESIFAVLIISFLALNSTLYPSYNLMNPYILPPIIEQNNFLISLISSISGCFLILSSFIIVKMYFKKFSKKVSNISAVLEKTLRTIHTFDLIFTPAILSWNKGVVPVSKWFYQIIIKKFFVETILLRIWKYIVITCKFITRKTKDTVIPGVVTFFKFTSHSIHKLEKFKLRTQVQIILVSLFLFIIMILVLYSGGKI